VSVGESRVMVMGLEEELDQRWNSATGIFEESSRKRRIFGLVLTDFGGSSPWWLVVRCGAVLVMAPSGFTPLTMECFEPTTTIINTARYFYTTTITERPAAICRRRIIMKGRKKEEDGDECRG
jgi:hypothetical protein